MNLLLGFIQSIWTKFYNTCVRNVPEQTRRIIGGAIILGAVIIFIFCTKGGKKGEMIGSWFLFWVSMICLICGVVYLSL